MSDDEIHIIPADEQSAEEVAEILTKVAAAQGLEDEVHVEGDEVIVPRSLNVTFSGENMRSFPPTNQTYTLQEPVALYKPGSAEEGSPAGTLEGFDVIVNQSAVS